jgi:hypothetical protein
MRHSFPLLTLAVALVACRSYTESTPRQFLEGDHAANYARVFGRDPPMGVTVLNSVVVAYSFRPGVVTTDDFEFELIVPRRWIEDYAKQLSKGDDEFKRSQLGARKDRPIRPWYAPKALEQYELYRDYSSVGYLHMLVQKEPESDGRYRVFVSKH